MSPWFTSWNIFDFGFKFAELFEFEFDNQISPLHDAAGSHGSPLHNAAERFDSPLHLTAARFDSLLHYAARSHDSLLHDAAVNHDSPQHHAVESWFSAAFCSREISTKNHRLIPRCMMQRGNMISRCTMQWWTMTPRCIMQRQDLTPCCIISSKDFYWIFVRYTSLFSSEGILSHIRTF